MALGSGWRVLHKGKQDRRTVGGDGSHFSPAEFEGPWEVSGVQLGEMGPGVELNNAPHSPKDVYSLIPGA